MGGYIMKQKVAYISVGMVFTLVLSFALISFADQSTVGSTSEANTAENTTEIIGNPVFIDEEANQITVFDGNTKSDFSLNEKTTIYRNGNRVTLKDIEFRDDVSVLLNSQADVRYVIATGSSKPEPSIPEVQRTTSVMASTSNRVIAEQPTKKPDIVELELKLELNHDKKYKLKYKNKDGKVESEFERETKHEKTKVSGERAATFVQSLISSIPLQPEMREKEIAEAIMRALKLQDGSYKAFELEITFNDGHTMKVDIEEEEKKRNKKNKDDEDDDHDDDDKKGRKGLENALEKVKGTPAEQVIANLQRQ
jgi:major membrane immunogen (membrane-anchored lipoprotein)